MLVNCNLMSINSVPLRMRENAKLFGRRETFSLSFARRKSQWNLPDAFLIYSLARGKWKQLKCSKHNETFIDEGKKKVSGRGVKCAKSTRSEMEIGNDRSAVLIEKSLLSCTCRTIEAHRKATGQQIDVFVLNCFLCSKISFFNRARPTQNAKT